MISSQSQGGPNIALITIVCGWLFLGFALLGVGLLIWSRRIKEIGLGPDGYLTALALMINIALIAQTTWAIVDEGQDSHEAEISKTKFVMIVRSLLISQTLWGLVNTLVRMSAILFVETLFGPMKWVRWIARSLLLLSVLYGIVVILEAFLICRPMAVDWNAHVAGTCGDQIVSYLVLEVLGLLLDLAILLLPILPVWRLQLPFAKKVSLGGFFSTGVLVFIVTGLRLQALRMVNAQDFTYSKGYLGLLSALGASLGVILCCASVVPFVYRIWRDKFSRRASTAFDVDVEEAASTSENPVESLPSRTEDNAIQTPNEGRR